MDKHQYEHTFHVAEQLHYQAKDLIDDTNNHLARELMEQGHKLAQDIRSQKNPRSLEVSAKQLEQLLQSIRKDESIMDFRHTDQLINGYRDVIAQLRRFNNY